MSAATIRVGEWEVPRDLFDQYVTVQIMAEGYLMRKLNVPSGLETERVMRWKLCVEQQIRVHRAICEAIGVEYSEQPDDPFYHAFHVAANREARLKG